MATWIIICWLAASIEGRLWNPISGAPVRKADVVVGTVRGEPVKRTVTDANGRYAVDGLAAGEYRVAAGRAGFLPALYSAVVKLRSSEKRRDVNIAMETPAVITGRVFDEDGEPVEGVPVSVYTRDEATGSVQARSTARTNDMGEYRLAGLAAGTYVLRAARAQAPLGEVYVPAYYPSAASSRGASPVRVGMGSEARNIDIRVAKGKPASIAGEIKGAGGMPVTLSRKDSDAAMMAVTEASATANQDGRFVFPSLPPGAYVVTGESRLGRARAEVSLDGTDAHVELTFEPPDRSRSHL